MKGFYNTRCRWIDTFTHNGHIGIKINDQVGENSQTCKGLRHRDPLSPIILNVVVDMLVILINMVKNNYQIIGVVPHLVDNSLSILQYADDTIIFMEDDIEKTKNLKLLSCAFEELSCLTINFYKSGIFCFGEAENSECLLLIVWVPDWYTPIQIFRNSHALQKVGQ
jgi:hypothetical protein